MGNAAVDILLALGVACELLCCVGVVVMRTTYDRLHYSGAGATVGPFFFLAALLAWGFSGLPAFGRFHGFYGQLLNAIALPQRHTTNTVTAVVFDYRGLDTMGEEFILFTAVAGVVMLLRGAGEASERDIAA